MLDLDTAYENFFDDLAKRKAEKIQAGAVRRPRAHKKGVADSFRFPQANQFTIERKWVKLPKAGWVRYCDSRPIEGNPKSITVSREGQHWYMSVLCERELPDPIAPAGSAIGVDLNAEEGAAVVLSNGQCLETAKTSKREWRYLRKLHRVASRRKQGSRNHVKAKARLAKFEEYRSQRRKDAIHKVTTYLAKTHAVIVIENLKVKNMTASARGTVEKPSKNVKAKAGLNRVLLDRAPGFVRQCLSYKTIWYGSKLEKTNPAYTSQKCSHCGHSSPENRKSTSWFCCVKCGHTESAHTNAAKNILAGGHPASACREDVRPVVETGYFPEAGTQRGAAA